MLVLWIAVGAGCSSAPNDKQPDAGPAHAGSAGSAQAGAGRSGMGGSDDAGAAGRAGRDAGAGGANAGTGGGGGGGVPGRDAAVDAGTQPITCKPFTVTSTDTEEVHFHHIHFNTQDAEADLAFFSELLGAPAFDFCTEQDGSRATRATRTERGYFLYTEVSEPPDPVLNTYLEHVGWIHPTPATEVERLAMLDAPFAPEERNQCTQAAAGMMACGVGMSLPEYYFYLQAPSGARIEIAKGPGPAMQGFGHVHLIQGDDLTFFATVSNGAYVDGAIDLVNHTDVSLTEDMLDGLTPVDTRGKPIDHIAYSTSDLDAARERIMAAGIPIAEEISMKPSFGFRSFFVRSVKGVWVELLDAPAFSAVP